jgi:serine/threonine protein kinase
MDNKESTKELSSMKLSIDEILTARRGTTTVKLRQQDNSFCLKLALPDNEGPYDQYLLLAREGSILKSLADVADNLHVAHGKSDSSSWLLTRWCGTKTSSSVAKKIRETNYSKRELLSLFISLVNKVEAIHQVGYLHGDIQPDHFLVNKEKAILIDWGLAHRIDERDFLFKGSFVHYSAPEIAKYMLDKSQQILYTQKAEVYSLASTMFMLYTGKTSTFYGSYDYKSIPFEEKLKRVSKGNLHTFESAGAPPYPKLENTLLSGLSFDIEERLTMQDFREALISLT